MADFFEPPYLGTPNPDEMFGTPDGEVFYGEQGADNIFGEGGGDKIYGGGDGDWIEGGSGNDRIWGEDGNDQMFGDDGDDSMIGGRGNDNMEGGDGDDCMEGKQGRDDMEGGAGNDCMHGNGGRDDMEGNGGKDTMFGGGGHDTMDGGDGADAMDGGNKNDDMSGGKGKDAMAGGKGNDTMAGGSGNDTMLGESGRDDMDGGTGNDEMDGGSGNDTMFGGDGNDLMTGGSGNDTLTGGDGADTFAFRQDEVAGNTDLDVITDWDSEDQILLCGQIDPFFTVEKVELGFFDNFANLDRDVRIGLSNGQFILLLDVGDEGDWEADDVDPENNETNADNFARAKECPIEVVVPDCDCGEDRPPPPPKLGSIGNFVWFDVNQDGIQDQGEAGVGFVEVELLNSNMNQIESTVTNEAGLYSFDGLEAGDYYVQFDLPEVFDAFTDKNQGGNPARDSDANPDGKTDVIALSAGENDNTIDAGLIEIIPIAIEVFNIVYVVDATGSTDEGWDFDGANPWTGFDGTVYNLEQNPNPTNPINDPNPPEGSPSAGDVIDAEIAAYKNLTESLLDEIAAAEATIPGLDVQANIQVIKFWGGNQSVSIGQFDPEIDLSKDALFAELEDTGSNNETNYGPPLRDAAFFFNQGLGTPPDDNPTDVLYFLGDNDLNDLQNAPTVQSQINRMDDSVFREAWLVPNDVGGSAASNDDFRDIDSGGLAGVETLETIADLQFDYINDFDVV